jgi:hypothetical protein
LPAAIFGPTLERIPFFAKAGSFAPNSDFGPPLETIPFFANPDNCFTPPSNDLDPRRLERVAPFATNPESFFPAPLSRDIPPFGLRSPRADFGPPRKEGNERARLNRFRASCSNLSLSALFTWSLPILFPLFTICLPPDLPIFPALLFDNFVKPDLIDCPAFDFDSFVKLGLRT